MSQKKASVDHIYAVLRWAAKVRPGPSFRALALILRGPGVPRLRTSPGRAAKNVTEEEALSYVAGYTAANDVTARRWQGKKGGGQWCRAELVPGPPAARPLLRAACSDGSGILPNL